MPWNPPAFTQSLSTLPSPDDTPVADEIILEIVNTLQTAVQGTDIVLPLTAARSTNAPLNTIYDGLTVVSQGDITLTDNQVQAGDTYELEVIVAAYVVKGQKSGTDTDQELATRGADVRRVLMGTEERRQRRLWADTTVLKSDVSAVGQDGSYFARVVTMTVTFRTDYCDPYTSISQPNP